VLENGETVENDCGLRTAGSKSAFHQWQRLLVGIARLGQLSGGLIGLSVVVPAQRQAFHTECLLLRHGVVDQVVSKPLISNARWFFIRVFESRRAVKEP